MVTRNRAAVFCDFTLARLTIAELRACDEAGICQTLSFVLMPDHLHWLVKLETGDLHNLVRRFKSRSAAAVNRVCGMLGISVWQRGYHDHAVRDDEDIRAIARYIVANPLRAKLVDNIMDYPHWDAVWCKGVVRG
ncbi:MAG: transposase [Sinobacteraceae bacterium]|nr:transposase [Nevskiaceae bacterium]